MSLFILTKAAHQEKLSNLSNLGVYLHRGDVAELIVSLWVPEHKRGKSCGKAALGYPSSHQSCQEPAAVELHPGCGAGVSSQHTCSVSPGRDATSWALPGLCMGRSGRDELGMKREYTLVWESQKYSKSEMASGSMLWKTLSAPTRLEGGIQDWNCVTVSLAVPALCQRGSLPWCCLVFEMK